MVDQRLSKITCPDCDYFGYPEIDYCDKHTDCGEFAYRCAKCQSLNVDEKEREYLHRNWILGLWASAQGIWQEAQDLFIWAEKHKILDNKARRRIILICMRCKEFCKDLQNF